MLGSWKSDRMNPAPASLNGQLCFMKLTFSEASDESGIRCSLGVGGGTSHNSKASY